ncbi:MAG: ankyrin repeat domain-containing protein [Lewinellaceae bacterium]|nr:ankyrin repeat domain-containing protein [Lewinellaceae bacterium]
MKCLSTLCLFFVFSIASTTAWGQKQLFKAIEKNSIETFNQGVQRGLDMNHQRAFDQYTPLMLASSKGAMPFVEYILSRNGNHALTDRWGNTALLIALSAGHFDVANVLMERGADLFVRNDVGFNTLMHACYEGGPKVAGVSLSYFNQGPRLQSVQRLIDAGVAVNDSTATGISPVMLAAESGNEELFHLLAGNDADIRLRSHFDGTTVIGRAAVGGNMNILKYLIEEGVAPDTKCQHEMTPFMIAVEKGDMEMVRYLLCKDVDLNYVTPTGHSALKAAVATRHFQLVDTLLKISNLKIDMSTTEGNELVATSILFGDPKVYTLLFQNEANLFEATVHLEQADSLEAARATDAAKAHYARAKASYEKCLQSFEKWESEYRKRANKISAGNALKLLGSLALSVGMSVADPGYTWLVNPGEMNDAESLYKIADKYEQVITYLKYQAEAMAKKANG